MHKKATEDKELDLLQAELGAIQAVETNAAVVERAQAKHAQSLQEKAEADKDDDDDMHVDDGGGTVLK